LNGKEHICWLTLGIIAFAVCFTTITYQQKAITKILATQTLMLRDYRAMSEDIAALRREIDDEARTHGKILQQMDLITAASRTSWAKAHQLIRSGVLDIEAQGAGQ